MSMSTIFEPSILFISEDEWRNNEKRDAFLEHLLGHLEKISNYCITNIYWTDALEELLLNHAYSPPWISNTNWRNQFFPILYKQFNPVKHIIQSEFYGNACQSDPPLLCSHAMPEVSDRFLELVHLLIDLKKEVYLCLGFDKSKIDCSSYCFTCKCHANRLEPTIIADPMNWFDHIDVMALDWPQNINDIDKLELAIEITLRKRLSKQKSDLLYTYEFSESFINDISEESNYRESILYSLAKKLTLTQEKAIVDEGLKDESVKGKRDERRFRVSRDCRIHYKNLGSRSLLFLNYYGEGKHDKGLK
jgi:hypothetical protein